MSLFNTSTWISLIRKEKSAISDDLYNAIKFSNNAKETLVRNTKGFVFPSIYPNQIDLSALTSETKIILPNKISKVHLIGIEGATYSRVIDNDDCYSIIDRLFISNQRTFFKFDETTKLMKLNVIPEVNNFGVYTLKDGINPVLNNADYGYYDLYPMVKNSPNPSYPIYDFKEINQGINYQGSTLSMLFTNVFSHISESVRISNRPSLNKNSLGLLMVLTDDNNSVFSFSFIPTGFLWRMYDMDMDLNVHICNVQNRINPFGDTYTPTTNGDYYKVQNLNSNVVSPDTAKHQIELIHNINTKQIDISDGDTINPLYCQTYESLRTIPTDEPDYFTRLFIDDNNYTYSNDCKTTTPHYFHTLIPPNIKELRLECNNHDGNITIPKFIHKSMCYLKPDVKYLYVVGSERELTELQFNTELYLAGYRDVKSRILPDDEMYKLYKAQFNVLEGIDNAFPITDELINSNQYESHYIRVTPNKQVALNAFKINLNVLKEQLLEQGILTRYNHKGELNYFKVIGILKDDCYYLISHYHYAVERNKDNEILSKNNNYQKLNYVCYSIALDLSKRVCNVLNNIDFTEYGNYYTRNNQILKVHNKLDLNTAGVMVYDNNNNPSYYENWLKVNDGNVRKLENNYSNYKANFEYYNTYSKKDRIYLSMTNGSIYPYLSQYDNKRHSNIHSFKYLKLTDDGLIQRYFGNAGYYSQRQKNIVMFNNNEFYSSTLCLYVEYYSQRYYALGMQSLFLDNHLTKETNYNYRRNTFFNLGKTFRTYISYTKELEITNDKTGSIIPNNTYYKELAKNIKLPIHSVLYMFDNSFRNTVTLGLNSYCDDNTEYIQNYKMMFPFMEV